MEGEASPETPIGGAAGGDQTPAAFGGGTDRGYRYYMYYMYRSRFD